MESKRKPNVIFLCIGNSARSQMAEAMLKKMAGDHFNVFSAGFEAKEIHPLTIDVMQEMGYDLSNQRSKNLSEYLGKHHFGIVITVCAKAETRCPTIPGVGTRLFWPFDDPASFKGTAEEKRKKFQEIRDQIYLKIRSWLQERNIVPSE